MVFLIIHGPTVENWDIDLGTVLIQDFYRTSIFDVWFTQRSKPLVASDTGLINGKNKNGTIGQYPEFCFEPGKKYRMGIINTSTDANFKFSIDQHTRTAQASDFIAVWKRARKQKVNSTILYSF